MSATDRSPGSFAPAPAPGRRERRKRTTRQALEEAALVLFARDGFDATTVEAIAERAEVSPRTFFRYFAAKEEVLDMGWAERRERLARLVREAPADADDLTAAVHALEGIAVDFEAERHRVTLRAAAVATSSALRGRTTDTLTAWEAALARGLAARRGLAAPDEEAAVAAAVAVALWRWAIRQWAGTPGAGTPATGGPAPDAPGGVPLRELLQRAAARLRAD
ncbi:TetR/AcrR family transcriptional regulator [uncultured Nocardioides sp.]|uniref:TetR/AcrR family transcriptional regulator n=1 Tax=uncultured Nocardioides sp. TaxID=198441 RepID=UPI000C3F7198|nr:TetR family transcriptional regulator [uncultured Nocardioides sp.]MAO79075.1 TetR family transcriptional regulator [Nocardioides sp.]